MTTITRANGASTATPEAGITTPNTVPNAEFLCSARKDIALESLYQVEQMAEMLKLRAELGDAGALPFAARAAATAITELTYNAMAALHDDDATLKSLTSALGKRGVA